ncbi:MAG: UPF0104 family protein [Bacteroidetes bacterium]|nr:MAG: UPF0104 family protein [Bacteroidota bacterium]
MSIRKVLAYGLPLLLSIVLMGYALQKVSLAQIGKLFQEANYFWLSLSLLLGIISHWARAYRWVLVLRPLGYEVTVWQATVAVFAGYFANVLIPRAGEVARCTIVQRSSQVPLAVSVGTIITERVLDILILFVLLVIMLLAEAGNMTATVWQFLQQKIPSLASQNTAFWAIFGTLFVVGAVSGIVLLFWVRRTSHPLGLRLRRIGEGIWQGIVSLRTVERKGEFIFYSLFIWVLYYFMGYILFFCFDRTAHLDMWFAYIILITGTIGMSVPVQGGAGAYHLMVGNIFALRNLSVEEGILLATFMHAVQQFVILLVGGSAFLYGLWAYQKTNPKKFANS